jgi:hypothetical protein
VFGPCDILPALHITLSISLHYVNYTSNHKLIAIMNNIPGNASQQPTNSGNEDYLDKGLDSAEKKFGGSMGQNTEKNRGVNEKIVS